MTSKKQKIIVIVGPTSSGKSDLAVRLAKKFNGEIISADSRQIYKKLDIGTGKIKRSEMLGIPHHLLSIRDPRTQMTAAEFKTHAEEKIKEIAGKKKIPIIVGGTGFWIDAVIYNLNFPEVPPDHTLRRRLGKKSAQELLEILQKLDPRRAKTIEQKNLRRLIRAIEISIALGKVPSIKKKYPYQTLWVGIKIPERKLKKRIHDRLVARMRAGMIREGMQLKKQGLFWKRFYELGLEYKYIAEYLKKKTTKEKFIQNLEGAINDYARRQMTWFKKNPEIHWTASSKIVQKLVKEFLKS